MEPEKQADERGGNDTAKEHIEQGDNQGDVSSVEEQACAVKDGKIIFAATESGIEHQGNHCQRLVVAFDGRGRKNFKQETFGGIPGRIEGQRISRSVFFVVEADGLCGQRRPVGGDNEGADDNYRNGR